MSQEKKLSAMSLAVDSHVKTFPPVAPEKDWTEIKAACGGRCLELLAWHDLNTLSWRMWQRSFLEDWQMFLQTFPQSGMTRNGKLFRVDPLEPTISESEPGLLPTPQASDWKEGFSPKKHGKFGPRLPLAIGGQPKTEYLENLIGLPTGFLNLKLSGMAKSFKSSNGSEKE